MTSLFYGTVHLDHILDSGKIYSPFALPSQQDSNRMKLRMDKVFSEAYGRFTKLQKKPNLTGREETQRREYERILHVWLTRDYLQAQGYASPRIEHERAELFPGVIEFPNLEGKKIGRCILVPKEVDFTKAKRIYVPEGDISPTRQLLYDDGLEIEVKKL